MPDEPHNPVPDPKPAPYDLEPEAAQAREKPTAPTPPRAPPRASLDAPPLLDDLDDDADLTADPEVERALKGEPRAEARTPEPAEPMPEAAPPLVRPGRLSARHAAIAGGVLSLAAVIVGASGAGEHWVGGAVMAAYLIALHTCTGVLALGVTAHLHAARLGPLNLVAARVLVAVAAFMAVVMLPIPGPVTLARPLAAVGAIGVYLVLMGVLFRPGTHRYRAMVALHAGCAALAWLLLSLHGWILELRAEPVP
ncbi:MAG: hypothetical protein DYG92_11150 [Leptolyngbya sp. PLA1]|nr:hypothetical protein [Leptolyngbya sp. PLA1]